MTYARPKFKNYFRLAKPRIQKLFVTPQQQLLENGVVSFMEKRKCLVKALCALALFAGSAPQVAHSSDLFGLGLGDDPLSKLAPDSIPIPKPARTSPCKPPAPER